MYSADRVVLAEDVQAAQERRQGVAQLVGQHHQELVLRGVRVSQPLFQTFLIVDVGAGPEPAFDPPGLVANRQGAAEPPAVAAGCAILEAIFDLERFSRANRRIPGVQGPLHVVGMEDRRPALVAGLALREVGVFVPAAVEVVEVAVGPGRPDDLRHGVGQVAVAALAVAQLLLRLFPLRHVPKDDDQPRRGAVGDDGRRAARHGKGAAVLADEEILVAFQHRAAPLHAENGAVLVRQRSAVGLLVMDVFVDREADQLLRRPAEQPFRGGVHVG